MNFTLDPQKKRVQKKRVQKKKGFKRNPLKREFHKGFNALVSEHIIQIHAIKPAVLELSA
ncbi:hypothetical protein ECC21_00915 [Helicobacter pylori]|nr:hypothetical protein ECC21_00915 [Helicobacter pylori]RVY43257.1 hypothetical protein ECC22_00915 [Helicobacter pylori]